MNTVLSQEPCVQPIHLGASPNNGEHVVAEFAFHARTCCRHVPGSGSLVGGRAPRARASGSLVLRWALPHLSHPGCRCRIIGMQSAQLAQKAGLLPRTAFLNPRPTRTSGMDAVSRTSCGCSGLICANAQKHLHMEVSCLWQNSSVAPGSTPWSNDSRAARSGSTTTMMTAVWVYIFLLLQKKSRSTLTQSFSKMLTCCISYCCFSCIFQ